MTDPNERCDYCGQLMNVLSSDYSDRCLDCRVERMVPFSKVGR